MEAAHTEIHRGEELGIEEVFQLTSQRSDGALQVLHRGVGVIVVVAVGVEHEQRTRSSIVASDVIHRDAEHIHHLHVLRRHGDRYYLVQALQRHHILHIDAVVDLVGILVGCLLVEPTLRQSTCHGGGFLLTDEHFHTTALGCRLGGELFLRSDLREGLDSIDVGRDAHVAVGVAIGIAPMDHIAGWCFELAHHASVGVVGQGVGAVEWVVATAEGEPQVERLVVAVTLDIDEGVAEQLAVDAHLLEELAARHQWVGLLLEQPVEHATVAVHIGHEVATLTIAALVLHLHATDGLGFEFHGTIDGRDGERLLRRSDAHHLILVCASVAGLLLLGAAGLSDLRTTEKIK